MRGVDPLRVDTPGAGAGLAPDPERGFERGFDPAFGLRAPTLQGLLASKRPVHRMWRRRGVDLDACSIAQILELDHDVRLSGRLTPRTGGPARGLVVLIHGWEGCHDSSYLYSMAARLHVEGYDVFRLNLRDHGNTHHLNRKMFHSARLGEVLDGVAAARRQVDDGPLYLIGFSLGGNFALRVALRGAEAGLFPRLTVAISPAINPRATLLGIDNGPWLFRRHFLDRWRHTLAAKRAAWPHYDFSAFDSLSSFMDMTRQFVSEHTGFASLDDYFAQYTLTPAMLMDAPSPLALLTAEDDSVIPIRDFEGLQVRGAVSAFMRTRHGGHCGFIDTWQLHSWAEDRVVAWLSSARD